MIRFLLPFVVLASTSCHIYDSAEYAQTRSEYLLNNGSPRWGLVPDDVMELTTKLTETDAATLTRNPTPDDTTIRDLEYALEALGNRDGDEPPKALFGTNWGVGPTVLFGGPEEIEEAKIVGSDADARIVVTNRQDAYPALLLETHYFFSPGSEPSVTGRPSRWGFGPFVALALTGNEVIDGIGGGMMVGFQPISGSGSSFNFGLGGFLDTNVPRLASGFVEGAAPPGGATDPLLVKDNVWRWMALMSFRFEL